MQYADLVCVTVIARRSVKQNGLQWTTVNEWRLTGCQRIQTWI